MNTPNTESEATGQAVAPAEEPKATKKATRSARKPGAAPDKGKSGKKASKAEKAPKKPKGAKPPKAGEGAREGSKAAKVLALLKRPDGATLKELMKATCWQPHSVRGYLSGTIGKKLGLKVESTKEENGERSYSVKASPPPSVVPLAAGVSPRRLFSFWAASSRRNCHDQSTRPRSNPCRSGWPARI